MDSFYRRLYSKDDNRPKPQICFPALCMLSVVSLWALYPKRSSFLSWLEQGMKWKLKCYRNSRKSSLGFGYNESLEIGLQTTNSEEHRKLFSENPVVWTVMNKCMELIVTDCDLFTVSSSVFAQFVSSEICVDGANKDQCSLRENLFAASSVPSAMDVCSYAESGCCWGILWREEFDIDIRESWTGVRVYESKRKLP
jgi:hypothetical protein